jgi:acetyl-CoA carboxylase carboxyl transferase subunit beta
MSLKDWFAQRKENTQAEKQLDAEGMNRVADEQYAKLWHQCFSCNTNLPKKDLEENLDVCPVCGYHNRIGAYQRIAQLTDTFVEWDAGMTATDPLIFTDTEPYVKRIADAQRKSKLNDAVITGLGAINEQPIALAVMDFAYMGGSMGSVVGEKITRAIEQAIALNVPVCVVTASGGARMQEGMFSLMQMVKTSAALARLHDAGLLYLTLLTEPTFGGVTASYGTLGDIIIAEEGARIGFAGRRVIEQTIHQKLPADFQTAGYLQKYGQVDRVLKRSEIKTEMGLLLRLHNTSSGKLAHSQAYQQLGLTVPDTVLQAEIALHKQPALAHNH